MRVLPQWSAAPFAACVCWPAVCQLRSFNKITQVCNIIMYNHIYRWCMCASPTCLMYLDV